MEQRDHSKQLCQNDHDSYLNISLNLIDKMSTMNKENVDSSD